jgi:hypothetical protein
MTTVHESQCGARNQDWGLEVPKPLPHPIHHSYSGVACELADARSGVDEGEKAGRTFRRRGISVGVVWKRPSITERTSGAVYPGAEPRRFRRARQRRE